MIESLRDERLKKLNNLVAAGIDPYPSKSKRTNTIAEVVDKFGPLSRSKKKVTVAGRIRSIRGQGGISFMDLKDESGAIQAVVKKDVFKDLDFWRDNLDISDFIEVTGTLFETNRGEKSIEVSGIRILSKSIRPIPSDFYGIHDEETRFRKRYLDLLLNEETKEIFIKKAKFWDVTREFLKSKGFLEVETPTLEVTTGGAEATPFKTHINDYDMNVYLRISVGELWQKRLMAAGFSKTFEIGRVFRNEGSSSEHLQEFTNMEFYWAYADYNDGMELVKEMYRHIAKKVFGKTNFETRGHKFDLAEEWEKIDYVSKIKEVTGIDVLKASEKEMKKRLKELNVEYTGDNRERLMDSLWKYCRKSISGPAFLINHPKLIAPLSKVNPDGVTTQKFQPLLAGSEVGNGYSELNDPIDQKERFILQEQLIKKGDTEAMMPDEEFVEMLEHGMPPTCGFGFGERLFSFMVDKPLRETQLFPLMKPKKQ